MTPGESPPRWLMRLTFGEDPGPGVTDPRLIAPMTDAAYEAIRCGLVIRPVDLLALTDAERAALSDAQDRVRKEDAALVGIASQCPESAMAVVSEYDDGLAHDTLVLQAQHDAIIERRERSRCQRQR